MGSAPSALIKGFRSITVFGGIPLITAKNRRSAATIPHSAFQPVLFFRPAASVPFVFPIPISCFRIS